MNQSTRTWVLFGILIVMIVYYVLSTFVFTDGSPAMNSDHPARSLSDINKSSGGLVEAHSYPRLATVSSAWGADPFYYQSPDKEKGKLFGGLLNDLSLPGSAFQLKGIVWSNNVPTILINDEILKVGDEINGYRIVSAGKNYVTLRSSSETVQLTLGDK